MYYYLPHLLIASFLLATLLVILLIKSSLAPFFADTPDIRKIHQQIIPRIGGLGIIASFLIIQCVIYFGFSNTIHQLEPFLFYAMIFISGFLLVGGTIDDVFTINYKKKFIMQFLLAAVIVFGFEIKCSQVYLLNTIYDLGMWGSVLSLFWIVGVMNAFNIIDGIDGLAASVSIIGFATLAVLSNATHAYGTVVMCVTLIGITGGFLVHNLSHRNKTFLGDTGSLFLGAVIGVLSIQVTQNPSADFSILVPLMIVGYPIFDISVAMVRRFLGRSRGKKGRLKQRIVKMFKADNEHMHHRLVHWGLSHLQTTFLLTIVAATMGSVAINISRVSLGWRILIFGYLIISLFLILNRLNYIGQRNWIIFPRTKIVRPKLIGVIEPGEVFFHAVKSYDQNELEFLNIPLSISNQFRNQLSAIIVHNALCEYFDICWQYALRLSEVNDCPVFVIADKKILDTIITANNDFKLTILIEKPVVIPELLDQLKTQLRSYKKQPTLLEDALIDLAEITKKEINV